MYVTRRHFAPGFGGMKRMRFLPSTSFMYFPPPMAFLTSISSSSASSTVKAPYFTKLDPLSLAINAPFVHAATRDNQSLERPGLDFLSRRQSCFEIPLRLEHPSCR